jgi:hypothetical protein
MDADLQDPPEVIPELVAAWRSGAEVVRAVRRSRQETGVRRAGFDLFHAVFGKLTDIPIEPNTGTFGLLGRPALEAFAQLPERNRFFPGLRAWIGFATADVSYDRQERAAGKPKQTFRRLVRYAVDGFFSFSYLPLRFLTYTGVLVSGLGFRARALLHRQAPPRDRDRDHRVHDARVAGHLPRRNPADRDRRPRRIPGPRLRRGEAAADLPGQAAAALTIRPWDNPGSSHGRAWR